MKTTSCGTRFLRSTEEIKVAEPHCVVANPLIAFIGFRNQKCAFPQRKLVVEGNSKLLNLTVKLLPLTFQVRFRNQRFE